MDRGNRSSKRQTGLIPEEDLQNVLRSLVIECPLSTWIADRNGTLVFENAANRKLFGVERDEEVAGKYNILEDEQIARQGFAPQVRSVFQDGGHTRFTIEYDLPQVKRVTSAQPTRKVLRTYLFAIKDEAGRVQYVVVQHEDYTDTWRAEKSLAASEARYRAIVQDQTELICRFLPDTTLTFVNDAYCRYFGRTYEELIGYSFLQLIPEADREGVKDYLASLSREHPVGMYEHPVLAPGAETRWQQWSDRAIFDETGRLVEFQSVGRDITDRRQMEEELRYHIEFQKLITNISTHFINLPLDEIDNGIKQALCQIGEFAGVDRSYLLVFSDDLTTIESGQAWAAEGLEVAPSSMVGLSLQAFPWIMERFKRFEVIHVPRLADLPPEARPEQELIQPFAMQSFIAVPMAYQGSLVGILGFGSVRTEKTWSEETIMLLKIVGEIFAIALERKGVEEELRRSEENLRTIFDYMPAATFAYDRDAVIVQANPACERFFGFPAERMVGRSMFETFARPEDRARREEVIARVFSGEVAEGIEWQDVRADGTAIYVLTNSAPVYDASGRVTMGLSLGIDITERKLAEQRRRELEEHKREFYRRTIMAATEGKLVITERDEIHKLMGPSTGSWNIVSAEDLGSTRHAVAAAARSIGMDEKRIHDFILAVGEAVTNAFKHAGGGTASLHRKDDSLLFVVSDRGPGIEALTLPEAVLRAGYSTTASLGMGYKAMLSIADKVYLATGPTGTTVAIEMKLRAVEKPLGTITLPETWPE